MRVPTSDILEDLIREAPAGQVTLDWIIAHLRDRSFGIVMLLIAIVGLIPGTSLFVAVLLCIPAIQMMLGRNQPILPRRVTERRFSTPRLVRLLKRTIPALKRMERFVRPRWSTPFGPTKRVVGTVILLLAVTLLVPVPFTQIIPDLVIMLLAFAFLEEDGVLLVIAMSAAAVSVAVTLATVWGAVEAGLLL